MPRYFGVLLVLTTPLIVSAGDDEIRKELKALQGAWKAVALEAGGTPLPKEAVPEFTLIVGAGRKTVGTMARAAVQAMTRAALKTEPKIIGTVHETGANKGKKQSGIYTLEGDRWIGCMTAPGAAEKDRPNSFDTKNTGNVVFIF